MKRALSFIAALAFSISCFVFPAQAEDRIKVACVGDSITQGSSKTCEYPANLQSFLDADKYEVRNFGHSGAAAMKETYGLSYWASPQFEKSKSFLPDIVIIMLGTNDVLNMNWDVDKYKNDLKELVQTYKSLSSNPQVYLCTPPSAFDSGHPVPLKTYAVPAVTEAASESGATLINVNQLTEDMGEYFEDGIHPNSEGYFKLARIFYENIFNGNTVKLTVKADEGAKIVFAGQQKTVGADGIADFITGNGKKRIKIEGSGAGFVYADVLVNGNTLADCTNAPISENLAFSATATDKDGNVLTVNDGDITTYWQRKDGDRYGKDIWIQYDLGDTKEISGMVFEWEESARPAEGGYTVKYSTDGSGWYSLSDAEFEYTNVTDTVTFKKIKARYIKIDIQQGSNSKFYPQLLEWSVFNSIESFTPAMTYENPTELFPSEGAGGAENDGGKLLWVFVLIGAAVIISAVLITIVIIYKKKKE